MELTFNPGKKELHLNGALVGCIDECADYIADDITITLFEMLKPEIRRLVDEKPNFLLDGHLLTNDVIANERQKLIKILHSSRADFRSALVKSGGASLTFPQFVSQLIEEELVEASCRFSSNFSYAYTLMKELEQVTELYEEVMNDHVGRMLSLKKADQLLGLCTDEIRRLLNEKDELDPLSALAPKDFNVFISYEIGSCGIDYKLAGPNFRTSKTFVPEININYFMTLSELGLNPTTVAQKFAKLCADNDSQASFLEDEFNKASRFKKALDEKEPVVEIDAFVRSLQSENSDSRKLYYLAEMNLNDFICKDGHVRDMTFEGGMFVLSDDSGKTRAYMRNLQPFTIRHFSHAATMSVLLPGKEEEKAIAKDKTGKLKIHNKLFAAYGDIKVMNRDYDQLFYDGEDDKGKPCVNALFAFPQLREVNTHPYADVKKIAQKGRAVTKLPMTIYDVELEDSFLQTVINRAFHTLNLAEKYELANEIKNLSPEQGWREVFTTLSSYLRLNIAEMPLVGCTD